MSVARARARVVGVHQDASFEAGLRFELAAVHSGSGSNANDSTCFGTTTVKWRRSAIVTRVIPSRSAGRDHSRVRAAELEIGVPPDEDSHPHDVLLQDVTK